MTARTARSRRSPPRRGSAVLVVMWALAIAAITLSSVQLLGYRQATLGQQALGRVQARWAARGGIEYAIAVMAYHTEYPVPDDAAAMVRELDHVALGDFEAGGRVIASWDIRHHADGRDWFGPMDEHSRININATLADPSLLVAFDDMTPDIVDASLDWMDADEEPRPLGAEKYYYQGIQTIPYQPRNAAMRNPLELELVAGIWPEHMRGEDWNFNNRLDDNENDGDRTWPVDDPDGQLECGWAAYLTTYSARGGPAASGQPRIYLRQATPEELMERLGVDETLASQIVAWGRGQQNTFEALLLSYAQPEAASAQGGGSRRRGGRSGGVQDPGQQQGQGQGQGQQQAQTPQLSREQLVTLLAETTLEQPGVRAPGKLNVNSVSEELLEKMFFTKEHLVDEIVFARSRPGGITSMVDVADIPAFRDDIQSLQYVLRNMDVTSNVYTITSRGRAWAGGVEVEIVAAVDRSSLPVVILEYREP